MYRGPPPPDDWEEWKRALALNESSYFTVVSDSFILVLLALKSGMNHRIASLTIFEE